MDAALPKTFTADHYGIVRPQPHLRAYYYNLVRKIPNAELTNDFTLLKAAPWLGHLLVLD